MAPKPKTNKRLLVRKLTTNFREAVSIETTEMCHPQKGEVCVKNKYVGVNASDVNVSKGRFADSAKLPFSLGFEGIGEIVEVGEDVKDFKVGQYVTYFNYRLTSYAEYVCLTTEEMFPVPECNPDYMTLVVSGLTATISLDKSARIMAGETVLITAAAGGAGHIAVQWAKAADCHVIGLCSTEEKEKILKDLGCDRVINYRKEDLNEVLAKEYPKGVDVIWETIGGKVFDDCMKNIAIKGRLVIVGKISDYKEKEEGPLEPVNIPTLPDQLLLKSASLQGFRRRHYKDCFVSYFKFMSESIESKKLKIITDNGETSTGKEFVGMEGIIKGVEHLYSRKSIGKVIVRIP